MHGVDVQDVHSSRSAHALRLELETTLAIAVFYRRPMFAARLQRTACTSGRRKSLTVMDGAKRLCPYFATTIAALQSLWCVDSRADVGK